MWTTKLRRPPTNLDHRAENRHPRSERSLVADRSHLKNHQPQNVQSLPRGSPPGPLEDDLLQGNDPGLLNAEIQEREQGGPSAADPEDEEADLVEDPVPPLAVVPGDNFCFCDVIL